MLTLEHLTPLQFVHKRPIYSARSYFRYMCHVVFFQNLAWGVHVSEYIYPHRNSTSRDIASRSYFRCYRSPRIRQSISPRHQYFHFSVHAMSSRPTLAIVTYRNYFAIYTQLHIDSDLVTLKAKSVLKWSRYMISKLFPVLSAISDFLFSSWCIPRVKIHQNKHNSLCEAAIFFSDCCKLLCFQYNIQYTHMFILCKLNALALTIIYQSRKPGSDLHKNFGKHQLSLPKNL